MSKKAPGSLSEGSKRFQRYYIFSYQETGPNNT